MPEWLLKNENYDFQPDKEPFINKSILSLLSVLSKIKTQGGYKTDKIKVNAFLKVAFTLILVALISISKSFTFVMIIDIYMLVILSFMDAEEIIKVLRIGLVMVAFTFIILLPAFLVWNRYSIIMITSKVFATVTAVNILSYSTRWRSITGALKRFFVPDIFILVLDITIKYIVMLGDFSLNMLYALKLRSVGKNRSKYTALSGIAGTMFLKSKEMAEDMYSAMECRGFTGEYHIHNQWKLTLIDFGYIAINVAIIVIFIYFERL